MPSIGLTAQELAQMRADQLGLMPDTCYILAGTAIADGYGGFSESLTVSGTAVCRLAFPNPGKESNTGGALQPFKTGVVTLPYDTTITTTNKLSINSNVYNITGIDADKSWNTCRRLTVEKIP